MSIYIGIKNHRWAGDREYTEDEVKDIPEGIYDYVLNIYGYESAEEWQRDQDEQARQEKEERDWNQKFIDYMNLDDHCPFCELLVPREPGKYLQYYQTYFELDQCRSYVHLYAEKDEEGRLCFYGCGEDYSEPYYPRYCPHCGRKLI